MRDHLLIRLRSNSTDCTWAALDGDGRLLGPVTSGPLDEAARAVSNERVIVLLPGSEVLTTQAAVPNVGQSRVRRMLPYLLEENFAEDVERLHFAVGKRLDSGNHAVSAITRAQLEIWLERLESAGVTPDAIYADTDGVPDTPSTLNLIVEGRCIYGRRPGQPAFVLEGLDLPEVYELLEAQSDDRSDLRHALIHVDETAQREHRSGIAELQTRLSSVDVKSLADDLLQRLAATIVFQPGANLLQGRYAVKSDWGELLRPWRAAAGLLLAMVLVSLVAQGIDYVRLQREDQALAARLAASCEQQFSSARISVCAIEVSRRLSDAGQTTLASSETFLTTLATVAEYRGDDSTIEALSYRNRVMDLRLLVPNVPALDQFAQNVIRTDRFDVRIESTADSGTGIEGRVRVAANEP